MSMYENLWTYNMDRRRDSKQKDSKTCICVIYGLNDNRYVGNLFDGRKAYRLKTDIQMFLFLPPKIPIFSSEQFSQSQPHMYTNIYTHTSNHRYNTSQSLNF